MNRLFASLDRLSIRSPLINQASRQAGNTMEINALEPGTTPQSRPGLWSGMKTSKERFQGLSNETYTSASRFVTTRARRRSQVQMKQNIFLNCKGKEFDRNQRGFRSANNWKNPKEKQ